MLFSMGKSGVAVSPIISLVKSGFLGLTTKAQRHKCDFEIDKIALR